ncbi:hypothetical protein [Risungbinella massiliensis]|uniref:hypothetical protein n=1 Tax=Risungbinella massiliensis TaxID=1329796 RepID=UPI0005CC2FC1|nr:hypothetical protein [Risungbinella massiliensis]
MNTQARILQRFRTLVQLGEDVLLTERKHESEGLNLTYTVLDEQKAYQFLTSAQNLLLIVFGRESIFMENIRGIGDIDRPRSLRTALGILQAAQDEFEHGFLTNLKTLLAAEFFDDLLEQAEHLLEFQYYGASAVITGCVLEDGLRRLCQVHEIPITSNSRVEQMNVSLVKAGVYHKLTQKQVTAYQDVRNKAAHGSWDQFTKEDVEDFIRWTRRFMEEHII